MKSQKHTGTVRRAFTLQANSYAVNPLITDSERLARFVGAVSPAIVDRVLDVATGPGFVAEAFFSIYRLVVGVYITRAPLEIAKKRLGASSPSNLNFQLADVGNLPFAKAKFDIVVSRLAIHHMENPAQVLEEMARVCRANGIVAVEDLIVSEHPKRAAYQNHCEKLRDASHTNAQPLTRLVKMFVAAGLEVEKVMTGFLLQDMNTWLANAHTPPLQAAKARALIERDAEEDLSGIRPFLDSSNQLNFSQRTAIVVGRKLA